MIKKAQPVDENVEAIRRIRREIRSEFKTFDEFFDDIYKRDQARLRREAAAKAKQKAIPKRAVTKPRPPRKATVSSRRAAVTRAKSA